MTISQTVYDAQIALIENLRTKLAELERERDELALRLAKHHPIGPREPRTDMVICPNCTEQFPALSVDDQDRRAEAERQIETLEAKLAGLEAELTAANRECDVRAERELGYLARAQSAEARADRLEAALRDAIECVEYWGDGDYASEYFKNKCDFAGDIKRLRDALEGT